MITKLSDSLMLFYIIMVASYFTNFLSCDLQRLFTNNLLAKHIIAFISAFFLITLVEDANVESLPEMLKLTVIIYAVYILSTKTKAFIILPVLMVLFIDQMIKVQVDILEREEKENKIPSDSSKLPFYKNREFLSKIREYVAYGIVGTIAIGVIHYYIRAKKEFGSDFDHYKFFLGTKECASK